MRRSLIVALVVLQILAAMAAEAFAKSIAVSRGIFGPWVAPMHEIIVPLKKNKRNKVYVKEWYEPWPAIKFDEAIGHSMGADDVLANSGAKRIKSIDPTFLNQGCPKGARCDNHFGSLNKFPLLICCGGYQAYGARNIDYGGFPSFIVFAPGHLRIVGQAAPDITSGH